MAKKETPVNAIDLAEEAFTGADEALLLGDRIARYGAAHVRTKEMLDYVRGRGDEPDGAARKAAVGLAGCGNYLHFREYPTKGKVRLHNARFCRQHLICQMCAIRRGAKSLGAYMRRWEAIKEERAELKPYLVTFTIKNGPDLEERQEHLTKSLKRLMHHRRDFNAGTRGAPWTELCKAEGAVYTMELTNKGKEWHPHVHMIVLATQEPNQWALREEWKSITGDSFMVDCRPITGDVAEGFLEVFKYAVKFSDLSLADNWEASKVLKGRRLLGSFGVFRGVTVPESLLDEPLEGIEYIDRFYRFIGGKYIETGESPKPKDLPATAMPDRSGAAAPGSSGHAPSSRRTEERAERTLDQPRSKTASAKGAGMLHHPQPCPAASAPGGPPEALVCSVQTMGADTLQFLPGVLKGTDCSLIKDFV